MAEEKIKSINIYVNKADNLFNKIYFIGLQHIKPILNYLINFIIIILIGRFFSVQELGNYITIFAVYQLLISITSMGMQGLLVKKIKHNYSEKVVKDFSKFIKEYNLIKLYNEILSSSHNVYK